MATNGRVLVVEDEAPIAKLLSCNLESSGYLVDVVHDGEDAINLIKNRGAMYDVIILDCMLPRKSGAEVCQSIREGQSTKHIPVIMLSARVSHSDKMNGFECGADDYVTKPFVPRELLARVKAVMRRCAVSNTSRDVIKVGDLVLDTNRMRVVAMGKSVQVSVKEFKLLKLFMSHPGHVFRREELLQIIWGEGRHVDMRTVDVHINRLRNALGDDVRGQSYIRTVRGSGYSLNVDQMEEVA